MTEEQYNAVLCAYADLKGALEAQEACDMNQHDWKAHKTTIAELREAFDLDGEENNE